jgi:hypothetical protein
MQYSASLLYRGYRSDGQTPLWEESIILVNAIDEDEATAKVKAFAKEKETSYENENGITIDWKFEQIERLCEITDPLEDNCELFSRFLRNSEVESLLTPFDD